jgi:hypothetical protein
MFDALYVSAWAGGAGSGMAYAVVGQYGSACTSGHENDAIHIRWTARAQITSISRLEEREVVRTRLCREIHGPTESRSVLNRIHAIIRQRRETPNEPLHPPSFSRISQPELLRKHLRILSRARITRDARADGARSLRKRCETLGDRRQEEGEVWRVLR